jgi:hypothetical protein
VTTRTIRVSEYAHDQARTFSGLLRTTPGALIEEALAEYLAAHSDEINERFEHAKKYIASRDTEGLLKMTSVSRRARAERAAARAVEGARPEPDLGPLRPIPEGALRRT